jgi:hypothetical protein
MTTSCASDSNTSSLNSNRARACANRIKLSRCRVVTGRFYDDIKTETESVWVIDTKHTEKWTHGDIDTRRDRWTQRDLHSCYFHYYNPLALWDTSSAILLLLL